MCRSPIGSFSGTALVDIIDDAYRIDREDRVHLVDNELTVGQIKTHFEPSAGWLEPWRRDTVTFADRLEATLQSMRRQAWYRWCRSLAGLT